MAQAGALEIAARLAGLRRRDRHVDLIAGFLAVWLALVVAFGVATLAVDLAVRKLDLTSAVVFGLLFVPVLLPIGLLLPNHPLVGLAAVGLVQRRWVGTKLVAAALVVGIAAARFPGPHRSITVAGLAVALAALGIDTFAPWLFALTARLPPPLSFQPPSIIWLEVYGVAASVVLLLTVLVRRALGSVEASSLLGSAAIAFFVDTLTLLMNGFLSLDPVFPWGFAVVTAGSLAATAYAGAALLIANGEATAAPTATRGD